MPTAYDFVDGRIAGNILHALERTDIRQLSILVKKGYLISYLRHPDLLTYRALTYKGISAYAEASGFSVRYFLFGSDEVPAPTYTDLDMEVIDALNRLSVSQLQKLKDSVPHLYGSPMMDPSQYSSPNYRFLAVLGTRRGAGLPKEVDPEVLAKCKLDVMMEISRYKQARYVPSFRFNSEFWPDLATLIGVSVHWLLGIEGHPLFCNHYLGDDIFDMYTLMQPSARASFAGLLSMLVPDASPALDNAFLNGR